MTQSKFSKYNNKRMSIYVREAEIKEEFVKFCSDCDISLSEGVEILMKDFLIKNASTEEKIKHVWLVKTCQDKQRES